MITLPASTRVFVAAEPVDGRKGFESLALLVTEVFGQDPLSGHLFVFFSRRRTSVRILSWDRTGWCLFSKRLERGCYRIPEQVAASRGGSEVDAAELMLILEGIELKGATRSARWRPEARPAA
jgi:transposase